jgi:heme-degrading monooxygenase HmoA
MHHTQDSGSPFTRLPAPPYYAVIFSSLRTAGENGYGVTADRMVELAAAQPGFLGVESTRGADGFGITVSYWENMDAIRQWKAHVEHQLAQDAGKAQWYAHFEVRISKVERAYGKAGARAGLDNH